MRLPYATAVWLQCGCVARSYSLLTHLSLKETETLPVSLIASLESPCVVSLRAMAYAFGFSREITSLLYDFRDFTAEKKKLIWKSNNLMMDFENHCLSTWRGPPPKGPRRYEHPVWGPYMRAQVEYSDTTWEKYCFWVRHGGGDFFFDEEEA
jgi:hypothetical protein